MTDGYVSLPGSGVLVPGGTATSPATPTAPSRTYWPIQAHKVPNATGFLDPGYYAGYPKNGVPVYPKLKGYWHTGVDYNGPGANDADQGNKCVAIRNGRVVWVGVGGGTWGNLVILEFVTPSGRTKWARYGHVQYTGKGAAVAPKAGLIVAAGATLAYIGKGAVAANFPAHLHFDILHTKPPRWDWWPARYAPQSAVLQYAEDPDAALRAWGAVEAA